MLEPGDGLALYTDGLSEAHAPRRIVTVQEMIGELQRSTPACAQESIDALLGLIDLNRPVFDDIAILAAHVSPIAAPARSATASQRMLA